MFICVLTSFLKTAIIIHGRTTQTRLLISRLGKQKVILGFPWLNEQNPNINWKTGNFEWRNSYPRLARLLRKNQGKPAPLLRAKILARRAMETKPTIAEEPDKEEHLNQTRNQTPDNEILVAYLEELLPPNGTWINAKTSNAIEFHLKHDEKKDDLPIEEMIPEAYHEYLDLFSETKADQFPEPRSWDHKIELKEGFEPKSFTAV